MAVLGVAVAVFCFGVLSISGGLPSLVSPLPLIPTMVAMRNTDWLWTYVKNPTAHNAVNSLLAALPLTMLAAAWQSRAIAGRERIPAWSIALWAVVVCLSVLWFVGGWSYGLKYQGQLHTVEILVLNVVVSGVTTSVVVANLRKPARTSNILFHGCLFCWLAWCAFPWLGELP